MDNIIFVPIYVGKNGLRMYGVKQMNVEKYQEML